MYMREIVRTACLCACVRWVQIEFRDTCTITLITATDEWKHEHNLQQNWMCRCSEMKKEQHFDSIRFVIGDTQRCWKKSRYKRCDSEWVQMSVWKTYIVLAQLTTLSDWMTHESHQSAKLSCLLNSYGS